MDFADQVVLVTGGAGRIGQGICRRFAQEGAAVAVVDRNGDAAAVLARAIEAAGGAARGFAADVSQESQVERLVAEVTAWRGPVHVLVNGAAVFPYAPLLEIDVEDWDRAFQVNVRGAMLLTRAVARQMIAQKIAGAVINITSYSGQSARADAGAYACSKAALNLLTQTFAIELGPYGIRVNAVSPGLVRDEVLGPGNPPQNDYDRAILQGIPLGRTASAEDVAEAVLFLAHHRRAAMITGAFLSVTGGSDAGRTHLPSSRALRRV